MPHDVKESAQTSKIKDTNKKYGNTLIHYANITAFGYLPGRINETAGLEKAIESRPN
jgi:hypothetical protein